MISGFSIYSLILILGALQGVFLSLAIINKRRKATNVGRGLLALLILSFSFDAFHEFLIQTNLIGNIPQIALLDPIVNLLYGPSLYLFVAFYTAMGREKPAYHYLAHFSPFVLSILYLFVLPKISADDINTIFFNQHEAGQDSNAIFSYVSVVAISGLISISIYLSMALRLVHQYNKSIINNLSDIESIDLTWLKWFLLAFTVLYVLLVLSGLLLENSEIGDQLNKLLYLFIVFVVYAIGYNGMNQSTYLEKQATSAAQPRLEPHQPVVNEKYKTSSIDESLSKVLITDLYAHMEKEQPYLDNGLTLTNLSEQMGLSSNYLSQIINQNTNMNFFDFVNSYRVKSACERLANKNLAHLSIIDIVYESGFNSKSAFYTAFKKVTGLTPNQYRERHKG